MTALQALQPDGKSGTALQARGVRFLSIPDEYYDDLRARLADSPVHVFAYHTISNKVDEQVP